MHTDGRSVLVISIRSSVSCLTPKFRKGKIIVDLGTDFHVRSRPSHFREGRYSDKLPYVRFPWDLDAERKLFPEQSFAMGDSLVGAECNRDWLLAK
jgi:hypothetical protein